MSHRKSNCWNFCVILIVSAVFLYAHATISVADDSSTTSLFFPEDIRTQFANSFPIALGSGLAYAGTTEDGAKLFYALTDSGPSSAPAACSIEVVNAVKNFIPLYGLIELKGGRAQVKWLRPLRVEKGIDPEGIALAPDGTLWIAEEQEPSLLQIEIDTGKVLQRLTPGDGIPEILKERKGGKGFEGLTISESGKMYAVLQAPLDIKGKTYSKSKLIRVLEYDLRTKESQMFGYDISGQRYKGADEVKLSAIESLGAGRFYVLERILSGGKAEFTLQLMQVKNATPLKQKKKKKEYEFKKSPFGQKVLPVSRETIHVFTAFAADAKPEGLAVASPDEVYVIEDNDFGIAAGSKCFHKDVPTRIHTFSPQK